MSQLDTWICPACRRKYLASAMVGRTICPRCQVLAAMVTLGPVAGPTGSAASATAPSADPRQRTGWVIPLVLVAGVILGGMMVLAFRPGNGPPAAGGGPANPPNPPVKPNPPLEKDKALVEEWLRDHLDDGHWEEVRWWPSITLQAIYDIRLPEAERAVAEFQKQVQALDQQVGDLATKGVTVKDWSPSRVTPLGMTRQQNELWSLNDASYHAHAKLATSLAIVKLMKERGPRRICAMRFRAKNGFGANRIVDALFDVTDGVATVVDAKSHTAWLDSTQFGWDYLRDPDPHHHPRRADEFSNPMEGREEALEAERLQREERP